MKLIATRLPDVCILQPQVFGDARGFFMETWNRRMLAALGLDLDFVQDNQSRSGKGVLRGLHYQLRNPQGKLVRVTSGEVFDVAVDLRRSSSAFGRWTGVVLSAANRHMLWIPPGFAHGFLVLSDEADFLYKTTDYYTPEDERCLAWNDPDIGIEWPLTGRQPDLSAKDHRGVPLRDADTYP